MCTYLPSPLKCIIELKMSFKTLIDQMVANSSSFSMWVAGRDEQKAIIVPVPAGNITSRPRAGNLFVVGNKNHPDSSVSSSVYCVLILVHDIVVLTCLIKESPVPGYSLVPCNQSTKHNLPCNLISINKIFSLLNAQSICPSRSVNKFTKNFLAGRRPSSIGSFVTCCG